MDFKQPEGKRIIQRLLEDADVLVQNLAPGAAARMGLDAESVARTHPQTITATISGMVRTARGATARPMTFWYKPRLDCCR